MIKFNIPLTGIIENMSFFHAVIAQKILHIWRKKCKSLAKQFNTKVISKFPILGALNEEIINYLMICKRNKFLKQ